MGILTHWWETRPSNLERTYKKSLLRYIQRYIPGNPTIRMVRIHNIDYAKHVLELFQERSKDSSFLNYLFPRFTYGIPRARETGIFLGWLELPRVDSEVRSQWLPKQRLRFNPNTGYGDLNMLHCGNMDETELTVCYIYIRETDLDIYRVHRIFKEMRENSQKNEKEDLLNLFNWSFPIPYFIYPVLV